MEKWIWKDRRDIECSHQVDYDVFNAEKEDNLYLTLPKGEVTSGKSGTNAFNWKWNATCRWLKSANLSEIVLQM